MTLSDLQPGDRVIFWSKNFEGETLLPVTFEIVSIKPNGQRVVRCIESLSNVWKIGQITSEHPKKPILDSPKYREYTLPEDLQGEIKLSSEQEVVEYYESLLKITSRRTHGDDLRSGMLVKITIGSPKIYRVSRSDDDPKGLYLELMFDGRELILGSPDAWPNWEQYWVVADRDESPDEIKLASDSESVEYYRSLSTVPHIRTHGSELNPGSIVRLTGNSITHPRLYRVCNDDRGTGNLYLKEVFDGENLVDDGAPRMFMMGHVYLVAEGDTPEIKLASDTPRIFGDLTPGQRYRTRGGSPAVFEIVGTGKGHIYSKCVVESSSWKLGQVREHHRDERFNRYEVVTDKKSSDEDEPTIGSRWLRLGKPVTIVEGTSRGSRPGDVFFTYDDEPDVLYYVGRRVFDRYFKTLGTDHTIFDSVKLATDVKVVGDLRQGDKIQDYENGEYQYTLEVCSYERAKYYLGRDTYEEYVLVRGWVPFLILDYRGGGGSRIRTVARDIVLSPEPAVSGHSYVYTPDEIVKLAVDRLLFGDDSYEVVSHDQVPQHIVGDVTWVKTAEGLRYVAEDSSTRLLDLYKTVGEIPVGTIFKTMSRWEVVDQTGNYTHFSCLDDSSIPVNRWESSRSTPRGWTLESEETVKLATTQMSKLPEGTVIEVNTGPKARTFTIISRDEFLENATSEQKLYYWNLKRGLVPVRWDDGSYGAVLDNAVDTNSGDIFREDSSGKPMGMQHRVHIKLSSEIVYDWITVWIDYHTFGFTSPFIDSVSLSAYLNHTSCITVKGIVGLEIASSSEGRVTVGKVKANSGKYTPLSNLIPFSVQVCGTRTDLDQIFDLVESGHLGEKYTLTQKQRSRLDPRVKLARGESTVHGIVTEQEEIPHTHPEAQLTDVPSAMSDTKRRDHRPGSVVYGSLQQMLPSSPGTIIAGEDGQANVIRNEDADSGVGMTRTHHPDIDPAPYSDRYVGTRHQSNEIKLSAIS